MDVTPFQLGAPVLVALAALLGFLAYAGMRAQIAARQPLRSRPIGATTLAIPRQPVLP